MVPPSLSLVLANRITRILSNKILSNCTIKRKPLRDNNVLEFYLHILSLGDDTHLLK